MSTTPLWFTALIAALGVLGSGGTAILTQLRADHRKDGRRSAVSNSISVH
jgi:hypothetical protein